MGPSETGSIGVKPPAGGLFRKVPFAHFTVLDSVQPAMSTLLGSKNASGTSQQSRPSHPVDAALWGLAERLAGGAELGPSVGSEPSSVVGIEPTDHCTPHLRVVNLPQRAVGLPSVGRMGRRNHAPVAQGVGIPTKPVASSASNNAKTAKRAEKNQDRNRRETQRIAPLIRRAEFTILKGRSRDSEPQTSPESEQNSAIRQESATRNENTQSVPGTAHRRVHRRRRTGVTVFGWLALTVFAAVAAAIALFTPSWF